MEWWSNKVCQSTCFWYCPLNTPQQHIHLTGLLFSALKQMHWYDRTRGSFGKLRAMGTPRGILVRNGAFLELTMGTPFPGIPPQNNPGYDKIITDLQQIIKKCTTTPENRRMIRCENEHSTIICPSDVSGNQSLTSLQWIIIEMKSTEVT